MLVMVWCKILGIVLVVECFVVFVVVKIDFVCVRLCMCVCLFEDSFSVCLIVLMVVIEGCMLCFCLMCIY